MLGFKYLEFHPTNMISSPFRNMWWTYQNKLVDVKAYCEVARYYVASGKSHNQESTPDINCRCGIYGSTSYDIIMESKFIQEYLRNESYEVYLCEFWGKTHVYENCFRSEYARIVAIIDEELESPLVIPVISINDAIKAVEESWKLA